MTRTVTIAAVQLDVRPAPLEQRLERAERQAEAAAAQGAQLVVLPELFNRGYAYVDENYPSAETVSGPTAGWMRRTAARLGVHLAGSLMLLDGDEVYNSLLLFAPDGRMWRYDKRFPWGWERAYFRDGHHASVAETDLGRIGMLICWDIAHPQLWAEYAGLVDLMLVASCPPDVNNPTYHLPDGTALSPDDMGPQMARMRGLGRLVFGDTVDAQAAWLGVPAVQTVGCGRVETPIPHAAAALMALVPSAPGLLRHLPQAGGMRMSCAMNRGCKVVDARGAVLAETPAHAGETFALATVELPDARPQPQGPQPALPVPPAAYLLSDRLLPWLMRPLYQRGVRRFWGQHMAPDSGLPLAPVLGLAALVLAVALARRFGIRHS
ncbi:MAG TPA: carbon-nitrogen hydrolase family protein [Roseiflexaceae bacterium]|nr:carbon-nitrogen hydrolase family protein [Roseiflexaceae bacterium]